LSGTGAFVPGTLLAGRYRVAVPLLSSVLLINHVSLPLEPRALECQARQTLLALWGFKNVLGMQTLLPAGALED